MVPALSAMSARHLVLLLVVSVLVDNSSAIDPGNSWDDCNFDSGSCDWVGAVSSLPDSALGGLCGGQCGQWENREGQAPNRDTHGTGPPSDHTTGNQLGNYMLVNSVGMQGEERRWAFMSSPAINNDSGPGLKYCLTMWVYMFGRDVGQLYVYVPPTESKLDPTGWYVAGLSATQGDHWQHFSTNFTCHRQSCQVLIEADVQPTHVLQSSDIAVDDLKITTGDC